MEGRYFVFCIILHPHSLIGAGEEWQEFLGGPAVEPRRRPGVVVHARAPDRGAAVMRRAAANHHRSLEGHDATGIGVLGRVFPVVRVAQCPCIEEISRPPAALEWSEI